MEKPSKETLEQWTKDPNNWKLGLFYYNPEDKRIFPPRSAESPGWTPNFANPKSVLAWIIIMACCCVIYDFLGRHK